MKRLFSLLLPFLLSAGAARAQTGVGINTITPAPCAALEVASSSQGILIPRMSTASRNAIAAPVAGLMVFDSTLNAFYFYNGASWGPVGGTAAAATGVTLQLRADKTGGTGESLPLATTTSPGLITFNNVVTAPTAGTWTGGNTFTVGAGGAGLYCIQVRVHTSDASPTTNTVPVSLIVELNGAAYGSTGNIYGPYPTLSVYTPAGTKGRGELLTYVYLNAGDVFKIKGIGANSSTAPQPLIADAGCNLTVIKMN